MKQEAVHSAESNLARTGWIRQTHVSLTHHIAAFWTLLTAIGISVLYQLFRPFLMEVPTYDDFSLSTVFFYSLGVGMAFLIRTGRRWTSFVGAIYTLLGFALGILFYYPVVTSLRTLGPLGWLEGNLYMGLLFITFFLCLMKLLGIGLTPEERSGTQAD